ncbi:MAG TPA: hypothetical protein VKP61_06585 [Candidatus Acidoferrum sp.]|nr:hypothetical protein [Candidatus Acidoferrum sp.]
MGRWIRYCALLLLAALVVTVPTYAQLSGALFTTDVNGNPVNQNIYPSKDAVYINGGPPPGAPLGAAGLPAGTYVFQVTDPSGKSLLSTDAARCRQLVVGTSGVITGVVPAGGCEHATGLSVDNEVTVQLIPYLNTPNNGGEYKAWVTPVQNYLDGCATLGVNNGLDVVDCGITGGDFHGFVPAHCKTDNFKVKNFIDREIDTHFLDNTGHEISPDCETWIDTLGVSNPRCTQVFGGIPLAHVEAIEDGVHQIVVTNQPNCTVGTIALFNPNGQQQDFTGPQTIDIRVGGGTKSGQWTIYVYCQ